jgi:hypothetical protein
MPPDGTGYEVVELVGHAHCLDAMISIFVRSVALTAGCIRLTEDPMSLGKYCLGMEQPELRR